MNSYPTIHLLGCLLSSSDVFLKDVQITLVPMVKISFGCTASILQSSSSCPLAQITLQRYQSRSFHRQQITSECPASISGPSPLRLTDQRHQTHSMPRGRKSPLSAQQALLNLLLCGSLFRGIIHARRQEAGNHL